MLNELRARRACGMARELLSQSAGDPDGALTLLLRDWRKSLLSEPSLAQLRELLDAIALLYVPLSPKEASADALLSRLRPNMTAEDGIAWLAARRELGGIFADAWNTALTELPKSANFLAAVNAKDNAR